MEAHQDGRPLPASANPLPPNREVANATGRIGPTVQDVYDFHYRVRVQESYSLPLLSASEQISDPRASSEESRRFDEHWSRLVACHDLCLDDVPLRGAVYKLGSLCGQWSGRFAQPHSMDMHMSVVLGRSPPITISLFQKPLYWTLREHHCLGPNEPLSAGIHESGVDDILNAWCPRGCTIEQVEDAIVIFDSFTERSARYETFIPGDSAHYSSSACVKQEWISGANEANLKEIPGDQECSASDAIDSYIDDDEVYADDVEHLSSGVSDIIVTGETGSPGDAWGHYQIIGRVRPWDGFVVLLQIPDRTMPHLGQWIFKGYIHDRNFVGRWRETSTAVGMVGLEGSFVMTRREVS